MYMYDSVNIHCNTLVMDDGECLILVNISMFCNRCKNLLAETYLQSFSYYCIASETGQYKTRTADYGLRTTDWV